MSLEKMFETLQELRSTASVDAAFGKPQEAEGRTLIPVSSVHVGMGLGFGQGITEEGIEDEQGSGEQGSEEQASDEAPGGGGGGGGAGARPVALIEVGDHETVIHPIVDETKVALAGIALGAWIIFLLLVTVRRVFSEGND
jgi:uncharacterized spore protein YtfJ